MSDINTSDHSAFSETKRRDSVYSPTIPCRYITNCIDIQCGKDVNITLVFRTEPSGSGANYDASFPLDGFYVAYTYAASRNIKCVFTQLGDLFLCIIFTSRHSKQVNGFRNIPKVS